MARNLDGELQEMTVAVRVDQGTHTGRLLNGWNLFHDLNKFPLGIYLKFTFSSHVLSGLRSAMGLQLKSMHGDSL